jgi:predicted nucleotidyltransferase
MPLEGMQALYRRYRARENDTCNLFLSPLQYGYMKNPLREAKQLAKTLVKYYKPEKIILFGSTARGDYHTNSDIDLLIIKQSDKKKHIESKKYLNPSARCLGYIP